MNRLILLGNGFDLAHGLQTRYNDFILWYLKKSFSKVEIGSGHKDSLMEIESRYEFITFFHNSRTTKNELIDYYYNTGFDQFFGNESLYFQPSVRHTNPFIVTLSTLMQALISNCNNANWVEIENEYYKVLKEILNKGYQQKEYLKSLNASMRTLVAELREYFRTIKVKNTTDKVLEIFASPILFRELTYIEGSTPVSQVAKLTHILNFNYTDTAALYASSSRFSSEEIELNYIHGCASDPDKPLIFGFGDELDSDYATLELSKINDYFEFIKSFGYLKTSDYYSLLRFIESDDYQVLIMGHSCGLSDRTMLNMLFKHKHCRSIKIYYHVTADGENNFTELTQEISRHFKDKEMLRERVVNFQFCKPMPQMTYDSV
ncbi:MAG TPA: AbiH family protein [Daejeonella sp.]|uniref:AbiH family protein n=1 Tax=Daejeonella sp. TaxID=2805397 RepID=UPI002ED8FDAF